MASKTTLNAKNLETLGLEQLAVLLMEISEGNANAKRRLRMELAGSESPAKLANEIRKRVAAIGASTANIGWRTLKSFRSDLNTQRRLIVDQVAVTGPGEALDLMWQFLALGDGVIERTSDASGGVVGIFRAASSDIATLLTKVSPPPASFMAALTDALISNTYGQNDGLIEASAPTLGPDGLAQLRNLLLPAASMPPPSVAARPRQTKRWRKRALDASETLRKRSHVESIRIALLAIADALGDVDTYISMQGDPRQPLVAVRIAERLNKANRPSDALQALDKARLEGRQPVPLEWAHARIAALEALGRKEEAQIFRLDRFHRTLAGDFLRAYLKRLPDFDDVEAEDEALDFAKTYPDANAALGFLVAWPALERAASMVALRITEMDGNNTQAMVYAADRLSSKYPFAALLLHRHVVEAGLMSFSEPFHLAVALNFLEAESLSRHIDDFGRFEAHLDWYKRLERTYSRRQTFWKALP
jgi:hypothetical protein